VSASKWLPRLALIQGGFYLASAVWPLIDIDSFQDVTGPKSDLWLVRTVAVLIAVIGAVLLMAGRRDRVSDEIVLLAVGCALGLAAIDIIYVIGHVISPVYLADAVAEIGLGALWGMGRLWR
jgi:hypothetical protein